MPTRPNSCLLASATNLFPGPTIMSASLPVNSPNARAAMPYHIFLFSSLLITYFPSHVMLYYYAIYFHLDPTEGEDLRGAGLLHGVQGVGVHLPRGLVSRRGADYIFHLFFLFVFFVTFFSLLLLPPLPWPHLLSLPRPWCIHTGPRARNTQQSPRGQLLGECYLPNRI